MSQKRKKVVNMTDTLPPPTPDPSDIPPIPSSGAPGNQPNEPPGAQAGKIDVIAMQAAAHDDAVATTAAQSALAKKAERQTNTAIAVFHEIRAIADNALRPALAEAAMLGIVPAPILYALQGVLVAIDAADDLLTRV